MLFNSFAFIFLFMPVTALIYFFLNKRHLSVFANISLILASFFFYGYFLPENIGIMLMSILVNYAFATQMRIIRPAQRKPLLIVGLLFNVYVLCYYKYANFFVDNINALLHVNIEIQTIFLPLAISFFTFQQISYLTDTYRGDTEDHDFFNYMLYICFFPKLIAGPLMYHRDLVPQFKKPRNRFVNWENVYKGMFIFSLGLFKKVMIADRLVEYVADGYALTDITLLQAWYTSLCYTMQLYFDFSGYCDMAMGAALFLNIRIPVNFLSPYKALNIQDFWRRWHITLSRWLLNYIYIPLGGNRKGTFRTYLNLFTVFLVGGFWHGAGWPFIVWGCLHGGAMVCHRLWMNAGRRMPAVPAWILLIFFVNIAWIFFRAETISSAFLMTGRLFDISSFNTADLPDLFIPLGLLAFCRLAPNSIEWLERVDGRRRWGIFSALILFMYLMTSHRVTDFIYANF